MIERASRGSGILYPDQGSDGREGGAVTSRGSRTAPIVKQGSRNRAAGLVPWELASWELKVELLLDHITVAVVAWRRECLLDRPRADPAQQVHLRPRLVVGP